MSEKIGYTYISAGTLIIIGVAVNIILVLIGNLEPIGFIKPGEFELDFSSMMPTYNVPQIPGLLEVKQPKPPTVSSEVLTDSMNLLVHFFIAGFLINVGFKIASIGTQMVRPIVVQVKKEERIVSPKQYSKPPQTS